MEGTDDRASGLASGLAGSVERYLEGLPDGLRRTPLAALAGTLAERLMACGTRETSALSKELRETLAELDRRAVKDGKGGSKLDELTARRSARLSGAADPARAGSAEQRRARGGGAGRVGGPGA